MPASLLPVDPHARRAAALIVGFLVLRLAVAAVFPFTIDEAYAVVVSRFPTLSYFDHPPLAFDFARLAAWLAGTEARFAVRLPHVLSGALAGWLLFLVTARAFTREAAFWAVAWYSVAPFFFVSAGMFVVPDGPLNLFLLATLWLALPMLIDETPPARATLRWAGAGVMLALALASKYQAVLFALSAVLILLATRPGRRALATPGPWIAAAIALTGFAPALVWNLENGFASFAFQSARAGEGLALHPGNFALMQLGQMAYLLPGTWAVMLWMALRTLSRQRVPHERLFAVIALVPVAVFDAIALVSKGNLPHWPMSGFLFAFPLAGLWTAQNLARLPRAIPRAFKLSAIAVPLLAFAVAAQAHWAVFTRPFFDAAPKGDLDWQTIDWTALRADFAARGILVDGAATAGVVRPARGASLFLPLKGEVAAKRPEGSEPDTIRTAALASAPPSFLVARSWSEAAKAGWALGPAIPLAEPLNDPRHFGFMTDPRLGEATRGYAVMAARPGEGVDALTRLKMLVFARYTPTGEEWIVTQTRAGFVSFEMAVVGIGAFGKP